jgi:hypothetical protein
MKDNNEQRARLTLKHPASAKDYLGNGIMKPLINTGNGIIFPYTPTIQSSFGAEYGVYSTTHSIYQPQYYTSSANPTIALTAPLAIQTQDEARYAAAMMHFLKSATKGNFGQQTRGKGSGSPPPVLLFNAYGGQYQNVPVVLKSASWTFGEDTDLIEFVTEIDGKDVKNSLPVSFTFSIDIAIQYPPKLIEKGFNINNYRNGNYLSGNNGFI